ncbi:hypothetical protein WJU16_13220 [Chitinophaga pollutisoli]|uniref:Uncharacterized protein n=1 Tax=Chitinophaga pollutisoli TaxID=3133966 RepID=A0ABZ2YGU5_9BACT
MTFGAAWEWQHGAVSGVGNGSGKGNSGAVISQIMRKSPLRWR